MPCPVYHKTIATVSYTHLDVYKRQIYCKVGDDDFGRFLLKTLRENNVTPLAPEMTKEAITTMAFVSLDENNDRSFTFARKPGADMMPVSYTHLGCGRKRGADL